MAAHPGQSQAWAARTRKLVLLAGWQSGKTDFAVWWCLRQMKRRGPGQAVVAAPSYPLLIAALQPRLVNLVESHGLGEHKRADNLLVVPYDSLRRLGYEGDAKGDLTVFFRHTQQAKDVEAVTALWFAGDEVGQMPDEVMEAVEGRLSATGGEACLISRPYFDNRFRQMCEQPDGETTVVSFASWDNPGWRTDLRAEPGAFEAELARLKSQMPLWRFDMKYGGRFTRAAGAVYDCWKDEYEVEPFSVPWHWKRYYGVDFGPVHTFVSCFAEHPTERDAEGYPVLYVYRTYFPNQGKATWQHVKALKDIEVQTSRDARSDRTAWHLVRAVGGSSTEDNWREEWALSGLPVSRPSVSSVEAGIDRVYACISRGGLRVFKTCGRLIRELRSYSYETDEQGEPVPGKIEKKSEFHGADSVRYAVSQFRPGKQVEGRTFGGIEYGDKDSIAREWD